MPARTVLTSVTLIRWIHRGNCEGTLAGEDSVDADGEMVALVRGGGVGVGSGRASMISVRTLWGTGE